MRNIEKYETEYSESEFELKHQVRFRQEKVLEILNQYRPQRILEIGCGMNSVGNVYKDFNKLTIVEPSHRFIEKAKIDLAGNGCIEYHESLFEECALELHRGDYDLILVSALLHEFEDPKTFLSAVKTICSEETILHVNVPNELSLHRIIAYEAKLISHLGDKSERNKKLQQQGVYHMEQLEQLVSSVGAVNVLDKGSFFIKVLTHSQLEQCLSAGIIDERILDGFYQLEKYITGFGSEIYINYQYCS